jgi:hypothetical protein
MLFSTFLQPLQTFIARQLAQGASSRKQAGAILHPLQALRLQSATGMVSAERVTCRA